MNDPRLSHIPAGIKIGSFFPPEHCGASGGLLSLTTDEEGAADDWAFLRHTGVECLSTWTTIDGSSYEAILQHRQFVESHGLHVYNIGILDLHCDPTIVLGLSGVDEKIDQYQQYLRNLGKAGIPYTTYAHMANLKNQAIPGYYQTAHVADRGGATTREFDLDVANQLPPSHDRDYSEDHIWGTFTDFIQAVMPVAEEAGVRIGLHPDDPPVASLGGIARCFRNFPAFERAMEIADSDNFGLCFCAGTWAEGGPTMGQDVLEMIRYYGSRGKIFKVHFRNVDRPLPKFHETFIDNGYLDAYQVMRALREVEFDGIIVPDHVPAGGYPQVNNAYTIGYMKALRDRVNAEFLAA